MSFYALQTPWSRLFVAGALAALIVFGGSNLTSTVRAESVQIFARVGLGPEDFLLNLGGIQPGQQITSLTTTTFSLTYASIFTSPTDVIVLTVSWGTNGNDEVLRYVEGSATTAIGPSNPIVDLQNKTITWQISPMPAMTQHEVYWQLEAIRGSANLSGTDFTISAKLIGPTFEKNAVPLSGQFQFIPITITPTPPPKPSPAPTTTPSITPTPQPTDTPIAPGVEPTSSPTPTPIAPPNPSVTPTDSPTPGGDTPNPPPDSLNSPPNLLRPLFPLIGSIPYVGQGLQTSLELLEQVAQGGGGLVVAPVPVLLTLVPTITTLIPLASSVPWWQLPSLLAALFWMRRRHQWGVVYDATTKEPIDPALVTLTDENGRNHVMITDYFGRYQFLVDEGTYKLKVEKTNYSFPADSLNNEKTDGVYDNLYYGEDLPYNKDAAVVVNIPMDNVQSDWNQQNKDAKREARWRRLFNNPWLFWFGFSWSLLMASMAASIINLLILGFYLLLILLRYINSVRHPWGVLYDKHNRPISGARIELIDINNPEVKRPPVITKSDGRFNFLVPKGSYKLSIQVSNESGSFEPPVSGPKVVVHSQFGSIARNLVMD